VVTAAESYAALVDASNAQSARFAPERPDRWAARAAYFRLDPRRELDANTTAVAAFIEPGDVLVDVGGGAGRISLPIALHCREVINVEPSAGMREQFDASAVEAGITNARCVAADWPAAGLAIAGDVALVANVTYFVRDIVPFIEALNRAARRLVIVSVWSVPPPNHAASLFELLYGERQLRVPTHRELLPVLWDLGILPDVRVLPDPFRGVRQRPPTREAAVAFALQAANAEQLSGATAKVEAHFDELFANSAEGFTPRWTPDVREMLITWRPAR
jgi:hypothetical protein